ncbi:MAG: sporulation initiation factor Spo0A C-terminal domain-containing protein [Oscillibacter sp.]|nr:sporulation initiation factor Spo0A C-terminal domain-containing protein [Oscillibacter sp.]
MKYDKAESEEAEIYRYLDMELGDFKHSRSGCRYLLTAIEIGTKTTHKLIKITDLYSKVAEIYNTKPVNVERSIRYCLHPHGWANKEFIYRAIEQIQYNKF